MLGLGLKDWAGSFIKGMKFRINPAFKEGDKVLLSSGVELEISLIEEIDGNMQVFNLSKIADNNNFYAN